MTSPELEAIRQRLPGWLKASSPCSDRGKVASYIPELSKAPHDALGITLLSAQGESVTAGDCGLRFYDAKHLQSFTLILALMDNGEETVLARLAWNRPATTSIPC